MRRSILPVTLIGLLALSACMGGPDPRAVAAGDLPPIAREYRQSLLTWARSYYPAPRALRAARISDPLLARDSTGRLVWLVCIEATTPATGLERQAFGFAPNYVSAPLARRESSLTRDECERPLSWRAFPQLERL